MVVAHGAEPLPPPPGQVDDRDAREARRQWRRATVGVGNQRERRQPAPAAAEAHPEPAAEHRQPLPEGVATEADEAGRDADERGQCRHEQGDTPGEDRDRDNEAAADQAALHDPESQEHPGGVGRIEAVDTLLTNGGHRRLPARWSGDEEWAGATAGASSCHWQPGPATMRSRLSRLWRVPLFWRRR